MINGRASIVLRLLTGLATSGVEEALIMPKQGGIRSHLPRAIERESTAGQRRWTGRPRGATRLAAPIAPGLIDEVGIGALDTLVPDTAYHPEIAAGAWRSMGSVN